jgi:hypothetical protein
MKSELFCCGHGRQNRQKAENAERLSIFVLYLSRKWEGLSKFDYLVSI